MATRHEVARFAVRAHVAADRISNATAKIVASYASTFLAQIVNAIRKEKTAEGQRAALLRFAADSKPPSDLIAAIRSAAEQALTLGVQSAAIEVGISATRGLTSQERKQVASRLDTYAAETARRVRLGMLQDALLLVDGSPDSIAESLPMDWGGAAAKRVTLVTTSVAHSALNLGRMTVLRRPVSKASLPYWYFTAILDENTSDICTDCDGVVLPSGHPWWSTRTPQLHFRCRSAIVGVTAAQMKQLGGITKDPPLVEPQEGFGKIGGICVLDKRPSHYATELLDRVH